MEKSINFIRNLKFKKVIADQTIDESMSYILTSSNINNDFVTVDVTGDGNCFYRSIAAFIFETEEKFIIIKICHLYILFKYKHFFEKLRNGLKYEAFLEKTSIDNEFADSFNILAISILLNRSIICFSVDEAYQVSYNQIHYFSDRNDYDDPMLIGHSYKLKHFVPVFARKINTIIPEIKFNFYGNIKKQHNLKIKTNY